MINAKSANQLYYIIDFLIEYISSKEKAFKEKINFFEDESRSKLLGKDLISEHSQLKESYKKSENTESDIGGNLISLETSEPYLKGKFKKE